MAVQAKARSSDLYEQDLYAWSEAQADLLRRRRFAELDLEHVVAEIEDVGGSLYREVRSRVRPIREPLRSLEYSAATERVLRCQPAHPLHSHPPARDRARRGAGREGGTTQRDHPSGGTLRPSCP